MNTGALQRPVGRPIKFVTPRRQRTFHLTDEEHAVLKRLGSGNATEGLRKLVQQLQAQGV